MSLLWRLCSKKDWVLENSRTLLFFIVPCRKGISMDALLVVVLEVVIGVVCFSIGFFTAKHLIQNKVPKNVGTLYVIDSEGNSPDIFVLFDCTLPEVFNSENVTLKVRRKRD